MLVTMTITSDVQTSQLYSPVQCSFYKLKSFFLHELLLLIVMPHLHSARARSSQVLIHWCTPSGPVGPRVPNLKCDKDWP